jgi:hypothetical protein
LKVTTVNEARGAQTISFTSDSPDKQFEIQAIPYSHVDVSADGDALHDAYGTNDQGLWLTDVNVRASGGVLQVWFVKRGVMYEVLGMEGQEAWLIDILKPGNSTSDPATPPALHSSQPLQHSHVLQLLK